MTQSDATKQKRMDTRARSMAQQKKLIDEYCDQFRPKIIGEYEMNGVTVTCYEAR